MDHIYHYQSPIGGITIKSNGTALTDLFFDTPEHGADTTPKNTKEKTLQIFELTEKWLDIYFSGKAPNFTPPILPNATPFRKTVFEIALSIPYGQTMTYGKIAAEIARRKGLKQMSAQAVGGALKNNPIALIIPCHRIIGTNGSLTGYAAGLDKKTRLLKLEKANKN